MNSSARRTRHFGAGFPGREFWSAEKEGEEAHRFAAMVDFGANGEDGEFRVSMGGVGANFATGKRLDSSDVAYAVALMMASLQSTPSSLLLSRHCAFISISSIMARSWTSFGAKRYVLAISPPGKVTVELVPMLLALGKR
jgi:hypothetical protein